MIRRAKIRVLVVDDSAVAREMIANGLSRQADLEVAATASNAWAARDKIVFMKPDVVTLDVEMPGMDGIEFLSKLMPQYPVPVIVVSGVTPAGSARALEALRAGALDLVAKPSARDPEGFARMLDQLAERIRAASQADMGKHGSAAALKSLPAVRAPGGIQADALIAIGASTGGTNVLNDIVPQFPANMPPVVIVQHMPPVFTRMFAEALDRNSAVNVKEARDGDAVERGTVLVAPGDLHMRVKYDSGKWRVRCAPGEKVSGHRPSVDALFESVAEAAGDRGVGLLLTGMGSDGARGLLRMRQSGARCYAQNEESSVVFGMPGEAWKAGAAERLLAIEEMTETLLGYRKGAAPAAGRSATSLSIP